MYIKTLEYQTRMHHLQGKLAAQDLAAFLISSNDRRTIMFGKFEPTGYTEIFPGKPFKIILNDER